MELIGEDLDNAFHEILLSNNVSTLDHLLQNAGQNQLGEEMTNKEEETRGSTDSRQSQDKINNTQHCVHVM